MKLKKAGAAMEGFSNNKEERPGTFAAPFIMSERQPRQGTIPGQS